MKENKSISPIDFFVGKKIRELRKLKGFTSRELGRCFGLSQQQISRYECGINHVHIDLLSELSFLFKTPIEVFILKIK